MFTLAVGPMLGCASFEFRSARIDIRVVDDQGQPVERASVGMGVTGGGKEGIARGETNTNGVFSARLKMVGSVYLRTEKPGYYRTSGELWSGPTTTTLVPPSNQYTVVLKKIIDQVPMVVVRVEKAIPQFDEDVGFDLAVGDWVAPHGVGRVSDLLVRAHIRDDGVRDYEKILRLRFPGRHDGIQPLDGPNELSRAVAPELPVPQAAPSHGYTNEWIATRSRRPDGPPVFSMKESNCQYLVRVRTKVGEEGEIKSANYGWILGDFDLTGPTIEFKMKYYFNLDPTSRSLEPDRF